jgi:hypothetical protein
MRGRLFGSAVTALAFGFVFSILSASAQPASPAPQPPDSRRVQPTPSTPRVQPPPRPPIQPGRSGRCEGIAPSNLPWSFEILAPQKSTANSLSSTATPTIYWRSSISIPAGRTVKVFIDNWATKKTLMRHETTSGLGAGLHEIALRETGKTLEPRALYMVTVALDCDPVGAGASDLLARACVQFMPHDLAIPAGCNATCRGQSWLQAGYWFDAMDALLGKGSDAESRAAADRLLAAEGLGQVAVPPP